MHKKFHILTVLTTLLLLFLISFVASFILIQTFPPSENIPSHGIIVIFGAGIYHTRPSIALQMRLDKGIDLLQSLSNSYLYLSGTRPEVTIMLQYLRQEGISPSQIIQDTQGKTTARTIQNLAHKFQDTNLILVSQQYHLRRIALLCKKYNLPNTFYVAAEHRPNPDIYLMILREVFALYKAFFWD